MSLEAFISGRSVITSSGDFAASASNLLFDEPGWIAPSSSGPYGDDGDVERGRDHDRQGGNGGRRGGEPDIVLAERTSQLMTSYRDYISGREDEELIAGRIHGYSGDGEIGGGGVRGRPGAREGGPLLQGWDGGSADQGHLEMEEEPWDDHGSYDPDRDACQEKYRDHHPIYRSKKFRRLLLGAVVATTIAGVMSNVVKWSKNNSLPDWDGELRDALLEEKEGEGGAKLPHQTIGIEGTSNVAKWSKNNSLPDWDGELRDALLEEGEGEGGSKLPHQTIGIEGREGRPPALEQDLAAEVEEEDAVVQETKEEPPEKGDLGDEEDIVVVRAPMEHPDKLPKGEDTEEGPAPAPASKPAYTPIPNPASEPAASVGALSDENIEAITRHILCCKTHPTWYDRSTGWDGKSYAEALEFCSSRGSGAVLCPYEAYCPAGPHNVPLGGYRGGGGSDSDGSKSSRAPIGDSPDVWVQVGALNACVKFVILDSQDEAKDEEATGIILDVIARGEESKEGEGKAREGEKGGGGSGKYGKEGAYTPPPPQKLNDGLVEEAYIPMAETLNDDLVEETYIPVFNVIPGSSVVTEELDVQGGNDGYQQQEAQAVAAVAPDEERQPVTSRPGPSQQQGQLAAQATPYEDAATAAPNPQPDMAVVLHEQFKPLWFSSKEGWNGGSHSDAVAFCESVREKKLCPYSAVCPAGPGGDVMGGRRELTFEVRGEQYAPILGGENHWVMIGDVSEGGSKKCRTHKQLKGLAPAWGLNGDRAEVKRHIMCCTIH